MAAKVESTQSSQINALLLGLAEDNINHWITNMRKGNLSVAEEDQIRVSEDFYCLGVARGDGRYSSIVAMINHQITNVRSIYSIAYQLKSIIKKHR